ncbi:phosphatase PAP2 family protein [Mechercharimyces sp. CAU 1602]|uniref:phosphatase PAP2 family protein n=1 Tax=Mechercharimyces sp. CAU 1602 TaxID=2973933 RepID=UPI002161F657|nr:phosphatase PAP2 family protein [Mechercharimyces sp. CAU 1602]MCS1350679.1 phosphatase PAP2 family protein [Mechercharimyces sp. CAU 1602]
MIFFQSPIAIWTTSFLTFYLLLWIFLRKGPIGVVSRFIHTIFLDRILLFHVVGVLLILLINKLELMIENQMEKGFDYTPLILHFEGTITPFLQQTLNHINLTLFTSYFYVIVFSVLLFVSLFVYYEEKEKHLLYILLYAISLNYLIAIPFYLFIPVQETWVLHQQVSFLIPEVYPNFEAEYRAFSGLDNSFPSLHTSLSVTMALIALRSRNRGFKLFTFFSGIVILFSIIYLGIHWYSDLVAGIMLASISVAASTWLSKYALGERKLKLLTKNESTTSSTRQAS